MVSQNEASDNHPEKLRGIAQVLGVANSHHKSNLWPCSQPTHSSPSCNVSSSDIPFDSGEIELRFDGITSLLTPGWAVDAAMSLLIGSGVASTSWRARCCKHTLPPTVSSFFMLPYDGCHGENLGKLPILRRWKAIHE